MSLFEHDGVRLRLVEESDLPVLTRLRNDYSTWVHLGDPRPVKPGLQRAWLDRQNSASDRMYFVAEDEAGRFVGLIRMDEYDLVQRSIRVGADVDPRLRRKGWGLRIYEAVKRYCFDELGLHRVWLAVLQTNPAAVALYQKAGFRQEGRYRQAVYRKGAWVDYLLMSILEDEYRRERRGIPPRPKKGD